MDQRTNGFRITGIQVRTTNRDNQSMHDLGELWGRAYAEDIFNKIPDKVSDDLICVYTDYKGDFTDEYTTILGLQVSSLDNIPEGMTGREFAADNFVQIEVKGEMPMAVMDAWSGIWKKDRELNRKYTHDFEVYGPESQNGANSIMRIYISVNGTH